VRLQAAGIRAEVTHESLHIHEPTYKMSITREELTISGSMYFALLQ
jgi:hypothetical protein